MKTIAAVAACLIIAGCAAPQLEPITSNPKRKEVVVDGQTVIVAPYSDGTWGATGSAITWVPRNPAIVRPPMIKAVEQVSGCKVTDANYDLQMDRLSAAVACPK